MKTKLLFVTEMLQVNGASFSLLALLKAIEPYYDVSLFLFSHDGALTGRIPSGVKLLPEIPVYKAYSTQMKVAVKDAVKKRQWRLAFFRLRVWLNRGLGRPFLQWNDLPSVKGDWDVVCAYADGFPSCMVMRKVAGGKKVLWVHENYEDNPKNKEILASFLQSDGIVGVSNDAIQHVKNILGSAVAGKTYVVHNIVDSDNVKRLAKRESIKLQGLGYNIVSVGRISPEKGYDLIPEILSILAKYGLDVDWSIIGGGLDSYKEEVIAIAKNIGVDQRIHFLGEKDNPHPFTAAADCFVQLSRHEGWCMTISEALCLNIPVVVNDLEVFHEQVFEGENGFFAHDVLSFAKAIYNVLTNKNLFRREVDAKCLFSPENVNKEFSAMLEGVCKA